MDTESSSEESEYDTDCDVFSISESDDGNDSEVISSNQLLKKGLQLVLIIRKKYCNPDHLCDYSVISSLGQEKW